MLVNKGRCAAGGSVCGMRRQDESNLCRFYPEGGRAGRAVGAAVSQVGRRSAVTCRDWAGAEVRKGTLGS